jgi:hypothetical protein
MGRVLEHEQIPSQYGFAHVSTMVYNIDMKSDHTVIRIWVKTLKSLRMIYALTGESMVAILDRIVLQELKRVQQEQKSEHGNSESL